MEKIITCSCSDVCRKPDECKTLIVEHNNVLFGSCKIQAPCIFVVVQISGMILLSLVFPGFSVDPETALLGYGIFTDQPGNTSWLMLAKDFQSMSHKNMLALPVNPFIQYCSIDIHNCVNFSSFQCLFLYIIYICTRVNKVCCCCCMLAKSQYQPS